MFGFSRGGRPGESLAIFSTELGGLQRPVPSGEAAPSPPPETLSRPVVRIAGAPALVTYAGLAPGFVGLYQVNVEVPPSTPSGTQTLQIISNGVPSNIVTIDVQ